MFYSGYVADKLNLWLARRNNGVHIPEHHLIHLIIPCITGAIGIIAIGVTTNNPEKYSVWGFILGKLTPHLRKFYSLKFITNSFSLQAGVSTNSHSSVFLSPQLLSLPRSSRLIQVPQWSSSSAERTSSRSEPLTAWSPCFTYIPICRHSWLWACPLCFEHPSP